ANLSPSLIGMSTGPRSVFFCKNSFLLSFRFVSEKVILSRSSKYCQYTAPHEGFTVPDFLPSSVTVTLIFPISGFTLTPSIILLKYPVPSSCFSFLLSNIWLPRLICTCLSAVNQLSPCNSNAYTASAVALVVPQLFVCLFFNNQVF